MTFWQFLTNLFIWFEARTTRLLAVLSGILVTLTSASVIPDKQLKYWMAAIAVLTYLRGQFISNTVSQARDIVKQATDPTPLTTPLVKPPESTG
jgi:hypothetical protein